MPEFNKRVNVQGLKRAERQFRDYVAKRLKAERGTKTLKESVQALERTARAAITQANLEDALVRQALGR